MPGIRVMTYDPDGGTRTGGEELLTRPPETPGGWFWVDLDTVDKTKERDILKSMFSIRTVAIQDAQRHRHPPKYELFDDYLFMLIRELKTSDESEPDPQFIHLSLFIGENFLITRRSEPSESVDNVWKAATAAQLVRGPSHIVYRICRQIVDHFTPFVIDMEERLGNIEDRMFE